MTWWTGAGLWAGLAALATVMLHQLVSSRWASALTDRQLRTLGSACPAAVLGAGALLWVLFDRGGAARTVALAIHGAALVLLFAFLACATRLQVVLFARPAASVANGPYRRLRVLTELVPAAAALSVLLTGLRLVWESPPANDPAQLWLSVLVVGFSLFFWDGLLFYRPLVARMDRYPQPPDAPAASPTAGELVQGALHVAAFVLLLAFGLLRPGGTSPLDAVVRWLEALAPRLPDGAPQCLTVLIVWLAAGALVAAARRMPSR